MHFFFQHKFEFSIEVTNRDQLIYVYFKSSLALFIWLKKVDSNEAMKNE